MGCGSVPHRRQDVTGSVDKTAIVWDAATVDQLHVAQGHTSGIESVAAFLTEDKIVTWSSDTIVWDATTSDLLDVIPRHTGYMLSGAVQGRNGLTEIVSYVS